MTTWGIMLVLAGLACLVRLRLATRPARLQVALEAIVATADREIREITRQEAAPLLPLIATLFVFIATANLCGVLPGVHAPTARPRRHWPPSCSAPFTFTAFALWGWAPTCMAI